MAVALSGSLSRKLAGSLSGWAGPAPPAPSALFDPSRIAFHLAVEDWTAASWPDNTGNLIVVQADVARQFSANTGINGQATIESTSGDYMVGNMTTQLAAGSRPFFVIITKAADTGSGNKTIVGLDSVSAALNELTFQIATVSSVRRFRLSQTKTGPASYSWAGLGVDTNAHVFELAFPNATTGHYAADGVTLDTLSSGTASSAGLLDAAGRLYLANNASFSVPFIGHYRDILCLRDQPSASELLALRQWANYRAGK